MTLHIITSYLMVQMPSSHTCMCVHKLAHKPAIPYELHASAHDALSKRVRSGRVQLLGILTRLFLLVCEAKKGVDSWHEAIGEPERKAAQRRMIEIDALCEPHCNMELTALLEESVCPQVQRTQAALKASPEGAELEALLWYQVGKHPESILLLVL